MKISRAHKIRLDPNNIQANHFFQCCGVRRVAYNWALTEWKRQYEAEEKPSWMSLNKQFNALKKTEYPWVVKVSSHIPVHAIKDLESAFKNFFRRCKEGKKGKDLGYPKYKRKYKHDSFYLPNQSVKIDGKKVRMPFIGWIRMRESWRFPNDKLMSAVVSLTAGKWYISFSSEIVVDDPVPKRPTHTIGVDVGIKELATTSDGDFFENRQTLRKEQKKLRRLNKSLKRKVKGSKNRKKAIKKLARFHQDVANKRKHSQHNISHTITKEAGLIGVEDLNIKGMVKNRCLALSISDAGMGEVLRQVKYKAMWRGATVIKVPRFYPSSKTCSGCGNIKDDLSLSDRIYKCESCGLEINRDLNAAINIREHAIEKNRE